MSQRSVAHKLISFFERTRSQAVCPCCSVKVDLAKAHLFYLDELNPIAREQVVAWREELSERKVDLKAWRKRISKSSQITTAAVNTGFVLEKLCSSLPSFPFSVGDCRALGDPIDLIIFEGLAKHRQVSRIIFGDVKSGAARLSQRQKSIQAAIEKHKVDWSTYVERD